ncbi:MAG: hypothetical protein AAF360_00435 [Pseudomonadota bacterium]
MKHLQPFRRRDVARLPPARGGGWRLKRYAIIADGAEYDRNIVGAAFDEAVRRLPRPGDIDDPEGNHGAGFQIVHFAEVAVVSPVFYWRWGSVLANIRQMRAPWASPTAFADGVADVVGCIWEMEIVNFEVSAWKETVLSDERAPEKRLFDYFERWSPTAGRVLND